MVNGKPLWHFLSSVDPQLLDIEIKKNLEFSRFLSKERGVKRFLGASHRTLSLKQTLSRLTRNKQKLAGVTRLSDVTGLDVIGIPTYVAIRPEACFATPFAQGQISIYNGKGFSKEQAKVSALMEAFERFSAEPRKRAFLISSYQQLKRKILCIDPTTLSYPEKLDPHFLETPIEWMIGVDLFTMRPIAVPASVVFCPYSPPPHSASLTPGFSSTGLASGNTLLEAIVHGLLEVVERHALSPNLSGVKIQAIRPEEISNRYIVALLRKLKKCGISIGLKYYKTDCEMTVCRASIDDPITRDPHLLCYGSGCHLSRDVAIIRALTEAVQTRLTVISGTREDMNLHEDFRQDPLIYDELCKEFWHYFELKDPIPYSKLPHYQHATFRDDLVLILKKLKRYGYAQAIAVNLTHLGLNIPVVRVVIPKLPIQLQPHDFLSKAAQNVRDKRKA